ncbi:MAG: hypothetical protein JWQ43_2719 [Glaciihabitans sp.]|nr:hypothetical protein [Glaciihabitans sp.]
MFYLIPVLVFFLTVGVVIDIVTRPDYLVNHLPKFAWVLLAVIVPLIGAIVWFAVGRRGSDIPRAPSATWRQSSRGERGPAPAAASLGYGFSDRNASGMSTEDQIAALDREIELHNAQAKVKRLEADLAKQRELPE